jgi:hypothetical protein
MFEKALRNKYRFESVRGELNLEQLWDLPLQSKSGCDLDSIAKAINAELKQAGEESFVEVAVNPRQSELTDKFEIVKHVIAVRLKENSDRVQVASRKEELLKLEDLLSSKKDEALKSLPAEELEARIAALRQ